MGKSEVSNQRRSAAIRSSVQGSLCLRVGGEGHFPGGHMASSGQLLASPIPNPPSPNAQMRVKVAALGLAVKDGALRC